MLAIGLCPAGLPTICSLPIAGSSNASASAERPDRIRSMAAATGERAIEVDGLSTCTAAAMVTGVARSAA
jgi:hypothetical protein